MIAMIRERLHEYDVRVFRSVARMERPGKRLRFWRLLSRSGDGPLYIVAALVLSFRSQTQSAFLIAGLITFALELPLYKLLKGVFRRQRPFVKLSDAVRHIVPPDEFSFPSGHAAGAVVVAAIISAFLPVAGLIACLYACLVGYSRVALGVHYPGDVLAGAILGLCCSCMGLSGAGVL